MAPMALRFSVVESTTSSLWALAAKERPGLYHIAGSERLSRWQIGKLLAARWPHLNPKLEPGSIQDFASLPRQPDLSLQCAKVDTLLSVTLPGLTEWLAAHPDEPF